MGHMTIYVLAHHVIAYHLPPQSASDTLSVSVFCAEMATSVHSDGEEEQVEESEPGEDGYWPALEILNERKHDYLVNWDGINPGTGRAWSPSWTRKTEVTEDLIDVWETKKAAKKKNKRRGTLGSAWLKDEH